MLSTISTGSVVMVIVLMSGGQCLGGNPPPISPEPVYVPRLVWEPPSTATPASAGVTFAIVRPQYAGPVRGAHDMTELSGVGWLGSLTGREFSTSLARDFEEILTGRGFSVRGPFETYGMMTYPDRENSDLTLEPQLEVLVRVTALEPRVQNVLFGADRYYYEGSITVGGRVTLAVNESLSNERMWVRSIEVEQRTAPFRTADYTARGDQEVVGPYPRFDWLYADPGFSRAVGELLEEVYPAICQTAWNYLEPEEMVVVKQQSQEPRRRWVTGIRR